MALKKGDSHQLRYSHCCDAIDPVATRRPAVQADPTYVYRPITCDPCQAASGHLRYRTQDFFHRPQVSKLSRVQGPNSREHRLIALANCVETRPTDLDFMYAPTALRLSSSRFIVSPTGSVNSISTLSFFSKLRCSIFKFCPSNVARRSSSSRSGSFISQCASRRNNSACGPPLSKPRAHSRCDRC